MHALVLPGDAKHPIAPPLPTLCGSHSVFPIDPFFAGVPTPTVLPDSALPAMSPSFNAAGAMEEAGEDVAGSPVPGDVVEGTVDLGVKAWAPPCLMVRLVGGGMGRVCVTEIDEEGAWRTDPVGR